MTVSVLLKIFVTISQPFWHSLLTCMPTFNPHSAWKKKKKIQGKIFPSVCFSNGGSQLWQRAEELFWLAGAFCSSCLLEFLCDCGNLLHSILVSSQVTLKGLVLPHQGSDLHQRGRLVVLLGEQLFLTWNTMTKSSPTTTCSSHYSWQYGKKNK